MVQRLAKGVIPANTQIQKDAITAMSKSATLFVNYLAHAYVHPSFHVPQSPSKKRGHVPPPIPPITLSLHSRLIKNRANTSPAMGTRKTISPEAVLDALAELEFDSFLPRVQAELRRFSEVQTGKRNDYRRKLKEKEENGTVGATRGVKVAENGHGDDDKDDGDERAAKRVRRDDDELATDAPSIPRKKIDVVENVDDAKEEDEQEEEEVEEAREPEDQSEEEDEESDLPADENGEDGVTEEDEEEDDSAGEEAGKPSEVGDEEDEEDDEDDEDHDTSVVDIDRDEEEEEEEDNSADSE